MRVINSNGYQFALHKSPWPLRNDWLAMEKSMDLPFCQTFLWHAVSFSDLRFKRHVNEARGRRHWFFSYKKESMQGPLCIGWFYVKNHEAFVYPPSTYSDIQDFIYSPLITQEQFFEMLRLLKKQFNLSTLSFPFVFENSFLRTSVGLPSYQEMVVDDRPMISSKTIEEWEQSISSHAWKHLRQSKKNLIKDGHVLRIEKLSGKAGGKALQGLKSLKRQRWAEKGWKPKKGIRFLLSDILGKMLRHSIYDISFAHFIKESKDSAIWIMYIDNEVACVSGVSLTSRQMYLQLALTFINSRFRKYSPGVVLLETMIRDCLAQGIGFDFLLGGESYKYRLGASRHLLYKVRLTL